MNSCFYIWACTPSRTWAVPSEVCTYSIVVPLLSAPRHSEDSRSYIVSNSAFEYYHYYYVRERYIQVGLTTGPSLRILQLDPYRPLHQVPSHYYDYVEASKEPTHHPLCTYPYLGPRSPTSTWPLTAPTCHLKVLLLSEPDGKRT